MAIKPLIVPMIIYAGKIKKQIQIIFSFIELRTVFMARGLLIRVLFHSFIKLDIFLPKIKYRNPIIKKIRHINHSIKK